MPPKEKSCLNCRTIYIGDKCSKCGETPSSDSFKGRVHIFNSENSEMADNMGIGSNGEFSIKSK
jgi:RNA polymerase subunit RPABC4/transcription elongation factor Spt4|tara:strand:+ start:1276 stop:1467 length:192 start_codon:yes stop_codon:yes gene_type:complete